MAPRRDTTTHTRTPSDQVERALLASAIELLEEEGPEALTVRRIASGAGVSPTSVYNHFDGKNGIVDAIFRHGFAELSVAMEKMALVHDPRAALVEGAELYRALALERPTTYALMFLKPVAGFEPSDESHDAATLAFSGLVACVTRGVDSGVLRPGDPVEIASQVWSAIHGAVSLELADIGFVDDRDRLYADLVQTVVRGLTSPGTP